MMVLSVLWSTILYIPKAAANLSFFKHKTNLSIDVFCESVLFDYYNVYFITSLLAYI